MSNPFAPSFAPSAAPVVQAPVPVQAPAMGLDDPNLYQGHSTPLLPNTLDGRWDLQILSVVGAKGYESGPAVHITFNILSSTNPAVSAGQTYRVFYRYDYERGTPVTGKQGTVHASLLGKFVAALFKREFNDPSFSKTQALDSICTNARGNLPGHDFGSAPGFVTLMGELRDRSVTDAATKVETKSRLRSDIWLPAPAAQ